MDSEIVVFLACQLADLLWPNFVLLGIERFAIDPGNTAVTPLDFISYPYSHSLVALLAWGLAVAVLYRFVRRGRLAPCGLGLLDRPSPTAYLVGMKPPVAQTYGFMNCVGP